MKRLAVFILGMALVSAASAVKLSCREDHDTKESICYDPAAVRVNGDLRSFALYTGGPKGMSKSANTEVANCRAGYLELRDRRGVVFARQVPDKRHIRLLRDDVCEEVAPKQDKQLN